jgi:hypothetical protein
VPLTQKQGAAVIDHDTLPLRIILADDGLTVYVNEAKALFLPALDVLALAQTANQMYAALAVTSAPAVAAGP